MLIQDLTNKTIIITGANSGIGFEAALDFAKKSAHVILAVRNLKKGHQAANKIKSEFNQAKVEVLELDISSQKSVHSFADICVKRLNQLDILVNNAGVMVPPYQLTKDGFEMQFGSNHLGHFALTGLLLPLLKKTPSSRVVTVSSIAHRKGTIFFDNLNGSKGYKPMPFYQQSKLANLLFAKELDQRLKQQGIHAMSLACHPGISVTNLFKFRGKDAPKFLMNIASLFLQSAHMGALPTIYAATEKSLTGGEYIGPDGVGNMKGNPTIETPAKGIYNEMTMKKLWDVSEKLTDVHYDFS